MTHSSPTPLIVIKEAALKSITGIISGGSLNIKKKFTVTDLWKVQKQRRTFSRRNLI